MQDFGGDWDWHLDPGLDFRIFHHCEIGEKFVYVITEKVTGGFAWNFQGRLDLAQLRGD